jgi:methyl-accepting chemotaxis protein
MDRVVKDAVDVLEEAAQKVEDGLKEVGKTAELVFQYIGEAVERNAELDGPQVPIGC